MVFGFELLVMSLQFYNDTSLPPGAVSNVSNGVTVLNKRGFFTDEYWYWIAVGALFAYAIIFNILFTLTLQKLDRKAT